MMIDLVNTLQAARAVEGGLKRLLGDEQVTFEERLELEVLQGQARALVRDLEVFYFSTSP